MNRTFSLSFLVSFFDVDAIIVINFTMAQGKHKVKGYNIVYKVPQEVHKHILREFSLFNA